VTEDGQTLQADVEDTAKTVIETTTTTSQVDSDGQVVGDPVVTTEKTDVAYDTAVDNKPSEITVDGKTYVLVGTAVEDASGQTQLVDGKVVTADTTAEEQGNVVEGTTEITYVYKLKEEPATPTGNVVARYVIEGTETEIADDKSVKTDAPVDEAYNDEAPAEITKDGVTYELVRTRTNDGDAPANGNVTEATQTITYEYKVKATPATPTGNVVARYVIEGTETEIADDKSVKTEAPVDEAYSDEAPAEITGKDGKVYVLSTTAPVRQNDGDAPTNGTVTEETQTITYQYVLKTTEKVDTVTKEGNVVVHYVIEDGQTLQADVEDTAKTVIETTTTTSQVDSDGQVVGDPVVTTEKTDVAYDTAVDNKPAEITVDGKTYVLVGTAVEDASGQTQLVDGKVVTAGTTAEEQGNVVEGTTEITYVYKLKEEPATPTGNVVARYVIEGTETEIADDKSVKTDAPVDEAYNDEAPAEITGKDGKVYVLSTTAPVRQNDGDAPTNGTVTEETQTITYQYVLKTTEKVDVVTKEGNVVVHYVTEDGQTLQADVEDTAKTVIETTTTTSQVDSDGQVVGDPVVTTEKKDVAYDTAADNKPSEITVDGKTYVLVGTAVEDASGQTQLVDGKVVTADTTAEEQGNVVEGTTEITYVYKLKEEPATPTGNVVARYVIEETETEIADDKSVKTDAPVDEAYSDEAPAEITKDGVTYELVRTRTNDGDAVANGTVTEATQTITYEYKVKETPATPTGNVVARYVIEGTETEIADDKSVKTEAPVDEAYNDEAPVEITKDGKVYVLSTTAPVRQNDGDAPTNGTV
ncbi:MucBP domain-containing protein, partial [Streptococcus saliviloxodontae]